MFKIEPRGQNYFAGCRVYLNDYLLLSVVQQILILLIFIAAVAYLGRMIYKSFAEGECASGCGKCAIADFKRIEKQLKKKGL